MKNIELSSNLNSSHDDRVKALKAVLNILDKWHCTADEKATLLGKQQQRSTYYKYIKNPDSAQIDINLLERLSYILNIHAALRVLFTDPNSVYNWVRKPNSAALFNGNSALDLMLNGRVVDLADVSRYLDAQRGGWS